LRAPPSPATATLSAGEGEMEIAAIDRGERAGRDMGDLDTLMACIAGEGLKRPIAVSPAGRLVLGARRLEACRRLRWRHIATETITKVPQALTRMRADNDGACCTHPLSVVDAMGMDFAVRELQWWPRDGSSSGNDGRRDRRRNEIAACYNLNGQQYGIARTLALAARGYRDYYGTRYAISDAARERAQFALTTVRDPSDLRAALRLYREENIPSEPPRPPGLRRLPSRSQEASVSSALGALAGIITGLASAIPLDPGIHGEVIQQWGHDTKRAMGILAKFRKELKRHGYSDND
jgi:ParB/Sulfiredoxin domain